MFRLFEGSIKKREREILEDRDRKVKKAKAELDRLLSPLYDGMYKALRSEGLAKHLTMNKIFSSNNESIGSGVLRLSSGMGGDERGVHLWVNIMMYGSLRYWFFQGKKDISGGGGHIYVNPKMGNYFRSSSATVDQERSADEEIEVLCEGLAQALAAAKLKKR